MSRAKQKKSGRFQARVDPSDKPSSAKMSVRTRATKPSGKTHELARQVFTLLEVYAPMWYRPGLQKRLQREVHEGLSVGKDLLRELYQLLENYSPSWYSERLHWELEMKLNGRVGKTKARRRK